MINFLTLNQAFNDYIDLQRPSKVSLCLSGCDKVSTPVVIKKFKLNHIDVTSCSACVQLN